jgi:outer membrane protein TolC
MTRKGVEDMKQNVIRLLNREAALRHALASLVGEAGRLDHNLPIPHDFWQAYRAAEEILDAKHIDRHE